MKFIYLLVLSSMLFLFTGCLEHAEEPVATPENYKDPDLFGFWVDINEPSNQSGYFYFDPFVCLSFLDTTSSYNEHLSDWGILDGELFINPDQEIEKVYIYDLKDDSLFIAFGEISHVYLEPEFEDINSDTLEIGFDIIRGSGSLYLLQTNLNSVSELVRVTDPGFHSFSLDISRFYNAHKFAIDFVVHENGELIYFQRRHYRKWD